MMNEANIKKMEELLGNEDFAQKIADAGSYDKAYDLFIDNGVEASYEDFLAYIEDCRKIMIENGMISEDGELSVEMLDMVSGGKWYHSVVCWIIAGVCFYYGQTQAGLVLVCVGVAVWNA